MTLCISVHTCENTHVSSMHGEATATNLHGSHLCMNFHFRFRCNVSFKPGILGVMSQHEHKWHVMGMVLQAITRRIFKVCERRATLMDRAP
jgi:hypothetical protein